jgi:hypothetical protein
LQVYFETTIFNRYFEEGREYSRETKLLFEMARRGELHAFTSAAVLEELDKAPEPKRSFMIELIQDCAIIVLEVEKPAYELADTYIELGIIPARFRLDGVHIAMAALNDMDCIVSLNFHHINKLKTKTATDIIHRMRGLSSPYICTPMEVVDNEE